MNVQPFELPAAEALLPQPFELDGNAGSGIAQAFAPQNQSDFINRLMPPGTPPFGSGFGAGSGEGGSGSLLGMIGSLLSQLGQLLQQIIPGNVFGNLFGGNESYFPNAQGGSTGDPHLAFQGSTWNNMSSQPDLLHSDSFQGGYQLSTQVTQPNQNGITYNQQATLRTNYGMTSVSLDKNGTPSIEQNGMPLSISAGQTIDLGNGETVTRNQTGLTIDTNNGIGGEITTTMTANGTGVDVSAQANNVDLGGALVNGQAHYPPPVPPRPPILPRPIMHPYDRQPNIP
ncbi:MAG TPA: hypothetical protein VGN11_00480 [Candidatus Baltobacteraceae bacterium]|jgi:hypothetical protein|nr:hypothetical protein [Candidatus Baltobacteraceae bacterium]